MTEGILASSMSTRKVGAAFKAIVAELGRADVTEILVNWENCELSEDGDRIVCYIGRDGAYSHGAMGGKVTVSKTEFLVWLLSDAPFDENTYGKEIRENVEWVGKIERARKASGLYSDE